MIARDYSNIVPDATRISSGFKLSRRHPTMAGVTRPHLGVDIAAPNGSPVQSPRDGTVVHVGNDPQGYGNYVVVQHELDDGKFVRTVYAHLAEPSSYTKGDNVMAGDQLGKVGSTGASSGNHLHYEERVVASGGDSWRTLGWKEGTVPVNPDDDNFGLSGDNHSGSQIPEYIPPISGYVITSSITDLPTLIAEISRKMGVASTIRSPIILDLDGDGVETTKVGSGAYFDHDANGFAESTGWVGKDDGLLVRDLNGNGTIDSGSELFGSESLLANGSKAANGFSVLAELDSNKDGKIDASDTAFNTLKVWKDSDGDGYSSEGELLSLTQAGVENVDPASRASSQIYGNAIGDGYDRGSQEPANENEWRVRA